MRLWNLQSGTCEVTLSGHKGQVTALKYSQQGGLLASGARDTDIIVWDVAAEAGLYRLRGHQDQVTDLVSIPFCDVPWRSGKVECRLCFQSLKSLQNTFETLSIAHI